MSVKISILGAENARQYLIQQHKRTQSAIIKSMDQVGFFMEGEVKESIAGHRAEPSSVDTGQFLQSIEHQVSSDINSKEMQAVIASNVEHAQYLEYGTSSIAPRRHFQNSLARNQRKVQEMLANNVSKI